MLGAIVMFVLIVACVACWPNWWQRNRWGYVPSVASAMLLVATVAVVFTDGF